MEHNSEQEEIIDISEYKKGTVIPKGKKYRFKVGRLNFVSETECMKGQEILEKAGKTPHTDHQLWQNFHGGTSEEVDYDQTVCFTEPGIEKFRTSQKDATDGRA